MSDLNIAVFGSSGAIGSALCLEYANNTNINKYLSLLTFESSDPDDVKAR